MTVRISRALVARIVSEADSSPDGEVCGLLLGDGEEIGDALPTANVAEDPARSFEVDPAALFAAYRAARAGGPRVIGHYHSHPNGIAAPSPRDAEAAEPGWLWMIVAGDRVTLWKAEEGATFRPMPLEPG